MALLAGFFVFIYPRDWNDLGVIRVLIQAVPTSIDSKMALDVTFIHSIYDVPVRTLQIILKANPFYFDARDSGPQVRYDLFSIIWMATCNFLDDAILSVREASNHGA